MTALVLTRLVAYHIGLPPRPTMTASGIHNAPGQTLLDENMVGMVSGPLSTPASTKLNDETEGVETMGHQQALAKTRRVVLVDASTASEQTPVPLKAASPHCFETRWFRRARGALSPHCNATPRRCR